MSCQKPPIKDINNQKKYNNLPRMLPKSKKLNLSLEENRSLFRKKPVSTKHLSIYWCKKQRSDFAAAVVVPNKVLQKAVDRNRVRRALYQVITTLEQNLKARRIIILMKQSPVKLDKESTKQLQEELTQALQENN